MKKKKDNRLIKDIFGFDFFCVLLFMVVTFVLVMKHELWFDEVQAWALADNLDVIELIKQMKYEGHSAMWSLFLKVFINMGFNYFILNFISWFIGCLSAILIIYKTKFSNLIKILLLFNISLVYYCTVFARPYSIIYLMFVLLIIFYKDRYKYPILVGLILLVLSNTHLMVMGFIAALFLIEFWEIFKNKQNIKEKVVLLVFMFIGVLLFFLQIVGSLFARSGMFETISVYELIYNFFVSFFYLMVSLFGSILLKNVGLLVLIFLSVYFFKDNKKVFFIFTSSFSFYFLISLVYSLNVFKSFYIVLVLMFCISLLILQQNNKKNIFLFVLLLLCSLPNSLICIYQECIKKVSDSYIVADYIEEEQARVLTFSKLSDFVYECTNCGKIVDYYDMKEYRYNNFSQLGIVMFNVDNFYEYLKENKIQYVVVPSHVYKLLQDSFKKIDNKYKDFLKIIYKTDDSVCVSDKFVICQSYVLFRVNEQRV